MRDRWITDWDQSERFPYYTRANAGEVLPDPSSPLNATLIWDDCLVPGWREGYVEEIGTHRPEELSEVRAEVIGNFGGYHYINLSATRMIGRRMPGLTVEAFDQQPMVNLVRHIRAKYTAGRLHAITSMHTLIVSVNNPIELNRENLRVDYRFGDREWEFNYFSKPFKPAEFSRRYPAPLGIEKFDSFVQMIGW